MQLSVEILDHIFSFLILDRKSLIACSNDPFLTPIVERHLYHHIVVQINGTSDSNDTFVPDHLSKLVSKKPRILQHVRILQIQLDIKGMPDENDIVRKELDEFAKTLLMFPMLKCIMLTTLKSCLWYWPDDFRAALEDRLNLPTLTEVHLIGGRNFPSSILDNCKNITDLTLSSMGSFEVAEGQTRQTLPQLNSLTLATYYVSSSLRDWLQCHISELQSLQCLDLGKEVLPELLGECSQTLNRLGIFIGGAQYETHYIFRTGEIRLGHFPELSVIPPNVEQLYIHAEAELNDHDDHSPTYCISTLPAAAEAINLFASSLQYLVLEIDIDLSAFSNFTKIDFSPLSMLGEIPQIDLYISTGFSPPALTRAQLISSLGDNEDITRSIEEGRLVIHSESFSR